MINFLKYSIGRFGKYIFMLGMVFVVLSVVFALDQLSFYASAIEVEARVERLETLCTLRWKQDGDRRTSDEMDCGKAQALKAAEPLKNHRLVERTRSFLSYAAPDGMQWQSWSVIKEVDGRPLQPGEVITAMIDPSDPGLVRRANGLWDLGGPFVMLLGSLAALVLGWLAIGAGKGGQLPALFWRWRLWRRKAPAPVAPTLRRTGPLVRRR